MPQPSPVIKKSFFRRLVTIGSVAAMLLIVLGCGLWMYFSKYISGPNSARDLYVEIVAPKNGSSMLVYLPDSSQVWLSPGSSLKYPRHFEADQRNIQLVDGVAYFSVKHNKDAPFTVSTSKGLQVQVLGTVFNIKAYLAMQDVVVSLVSGSVKVRDGKRQLGVLKPNQQLMYSAATGTSSISATDAEQSGMWRQGIIQLKDAGLDEVALTLSNLYRVKVSYDKQKLSSYKFNFRFSTSMTIMEVLELMKSLSDIEYVKKGNEVNIFLQ
jgi:ferric-dicitrate binding protein FerR (iron transport regulator)